MTEVIHKHHIIPKYKCKELGIDPDFDDNLVEVTRHQHALIHWGYMHNDLKPLLEVCNPPQWVIDMIPLGDNRDSGAAVLTARGEIEQIDMSGEKNPMWKGGIATGDNLKEYMKVYNQTPKVKEYLKAYQQTPEYKAYKKAYGQTSKYKTYQKEYRQKPEVKENKKAYMRARHAKKKQQGQGTLEEFMK